MERLEELDGISSSTSVDDEDDDDDDAPARGEPRGRGSAGPTVAAARSSPGTPRSSATSTGWSTGARRRCRMPWRRSPRLDVPVVYATNNASRPPRTSRSTCASSACTARPRRSRPARRRAPGCCGAARRRAAPVLAVGGPGVARALAEAGLTPVLPPRRADSVAARGGAPGVRRRRSPQPTWPRRRMPCRAAPPGSRRTPTPPCRPTVAWRRATGRSSVPSNVPSADRPTSWPASRRRRSTSCAPTASASTRVGCWRSGTDSTPTSRVPSPPAWTRSSC